jgi:hypothetical protein
VIESTTANDLLNRAQRNSLSIMMCESEKTLRHIPDNLTSSERGTLYEYQSSIPTKTLSQIQQQIALAIPDIDSLAKELDLYRTVQSNTSTLLGQLAVLWSDLSDIRVEKLIRYGDVSPELNTVLTPALTRLIQRTEYLMNLLREHSPNDDAQP